MGDQGAEQGEDGVLGELVRLRPVLLQSPVEHGAEQLGVGPLEVQSDRLEGRQLLARLLGARRHRGVQVEQDRQKVLSVPAS